MKPLLRLSALLAVLALVALAAGAQVVSIDMGPFLDARLVTPESASTLEPRITVPVGPRPTPTPPVTYPADGFFVYEADPTCPGSSNVVLAAAPAICMRAEALEWLADEVRYSRLTPGPAWRDCTYPSDPNWASCLSYTFRSYAPEIRFGQSRKWTYGVLAQVPQWVCATGIAYSGFIRVSLASPVAYRLVAWETLNSALHYRLDRKDLTDGAVVSAGTNAAAQACGVN